MRTELIKATTHKKAKAIAYWAVVIKKVPGGYMAFETWPDYYKWDKEQ